MSGQHGAQRSGRERILDAAAEYGWIVAEGDVACSIRRGPYRLIVGFTAAGAVKHARRIRTVGRDARDVRTYGGRYKAERIVAELARLGEEPVRRPLTLVSSP